MNRQLTFAFTGRWKDFMALAKAMRGIKGSFYRGGKA